MYIACDIQRNRIPIDEVKKGESYQCPVCDKPLVVKNRGQIMKPHFAHYPKQPCTDTWESTERGYDMSDWHFKWQTKFRSQNQEVVLALQQEKHRADVLLGKTVVEFQKGKMSAKYFCERNKFFCKLGYRVVWLFDFSEEYREKKCGTEKKDTKFVWPYPPKMFDVFLADRKPWEEVQVFFRIKENEDELCLFQVPEPQSKALKGFEIQKWYTASDFLDYLNKKSETPLDSDYIQFCCRYLQNCDVTLFPEREQAIKTIEGPCLFLTKTADGKMDVPAIRICYMIKGKQIRPETIAVLTTRRKNEKIRETIREKFGDEFYKQEIDKRVRFFTLKALLNKVKEKALKSEFGGTADFEKGGTEELQDYVKVAKILQENERLCEEVTNWMKYIWLESAEQLSNEEYEFVRVLARSGNIFMSALKDYQQQHMLPVCLHKFQEDFSPVRISGPDYGPETR